MIEYIEFWLARKFAELILLLIFMAVLFVGYFIYCYVMWWKEKRRKNRIRK